jgi:RNA polymerase sigma-70 factor (ECF subfamily)
MSSPAAKAESDEELVTRLCAGDERAFTQLYRRHARYIAGVARRLMGDELELDEVVQEAFLALRDQAPSIQERARVRAWLVRVTVRGATKRLEKRRRRRRLLAAQPPPRRSTDPVADHELRALFEVLERLAPTLRVPWSLHRIEGETLPRTAELCEISLATVKRRVAKADARIRKALGREEGR